MDQKINQLFTRKNIKPHQILYMVRDDRKTILHLTDGRREESYIPMKYLLNALPDGAFLNINKGIVISSANIHSIEGNTYTLKNGQQFVGRQRAGGEHKTNRHRLENRPSAEHRLINISFSEQFTLLDKSPLPSCIVQMIFDSTGHGVDFVFRHCNQAMLDFEEIDRESIIDRSYYECFYSGDRKWIRAYTDIATNGGFCRVTDYNAKKGLRVTGFCHQLMRGFCLCILVPEEPPTENTPTG